MIRVDELCKRFKYYHNPSDRLKEVVLRRSFHRSHQVLDGVSFELQPGHCLGVLGKNGAGKSTLLKILTGILQADSGEVLVEDKVTGLLELGTGFDSNLTGSANILINGLLLGMSKAEIEARREQIIAFSELGEFIHETLRTYSSGMVMRLAFSIAIHADPKCFVVDEALAVGDAHFQQKCMRRIREFRESGGSIIFVSHDLNAVKMICDRTLVLDQGRVVFDGSPEDAVNHYNRLIADEEDQQELDMRSRDNSYGNGQVEILSAELAGVDSGANVVTAGEEMTISIRCVAHTDIDDMTAGFVIRDRFGQDVFGTNSFHLGTIIRLQSGEERDIKFTLPMDISPGHYTVTVALHSRENHLENCYHWADSIAQFEVAGIRGAGFSGVCRLPTRIE